MSFKRKQKQVDNLPPSYGLPPDFQWSQSSILFLIKTVQDNFEDFYNRTLKKKVLWKKIAAVMNEKGFSCISDECDKKWRNLKKTYLTVLQKQVQGDFSSKFAYFHKMHSFIGKEVDPLGMREQRLCKSIIGKRSSSNRKPPEEFKDVKCDGNLMWTDSSVYALLDEIMKKKENFDERMSNEIIKIQIDAIWKKISSQVNLKGYRTDYMICQRKWCNLCAGFKHYQAKAENLGLHPLWPYFSRVREVINAMNVPVGIGDEKQFSSLGPSTSTAEYLPTINANGDASYNESIEIDTNYEATSANNLQFKSLIAKINKISKSLDVENYYVNLQNRMVLVDELSKSNEQETALLKDILQRIENCNALLQQTENSAILPDYPQNSVINISDLPSLTFNNGSNAADEENQIIIVDGDNEFVLQC